MKVFSTAISSGALGLCTSINLGFNNIGDVGMQAFSDAIRSGALPKSKSVYVSGNPGNADPLKAACKSRGIKCDA